MDINFGSLVDTIKSHLSALEQRFGHLKEGGGFTFSDNSAQLWHDTLTGVHAAVSALHEGAEPAIASAISGAKGDIQSIVANYLAPAIEEFRKAHASQLDAVDEKIAALLAKAEAFAHSNSDLLNHVTGRLSQIESNLAPKCEMTVAGPAIATDAKTE